MHCATQVHTGLNTERSTTKAATLVDWGEKNVQQRKPRLIHRRQRSRASSSFLAFFREAKLFPQVFCPTLKQLAARIQSNTELVDILMMNHVDELVMNQTERCFELIGSLFCQSPLFPKPSGGGCSFRWTAM
jgi:hypothetical protein